MYGRTVKERDVIDAEFEVVRGPTHEPFSWEGLATLITSIIVGAACLVAGVAIYKVAWWATGYLFGN